MQHARYDPVLLTGDSATTITALAWPSVLPAQDYRYTVVRPLAGGSTSELFEARWDGAAGFQRSVVIKQIREEHAAIPEVVRVLLDEARIGGQVQHAGIVQVCDLGRHRGRWYYAMERVDGVTLDRIAARARSRRMRIGIPAALSIVTRLCAALHHLHDRQGAEGAWLQIVHGDVSPARVFVTGDGGVKLRISPATTCTGLTRTVTVAGTWAYASPEQLADEPTDRRSDLYALGVVLWELTTGLPLYAGQSELDTFRAIVEVDPPRPSRCVRDYPPALEDIVMRCLHRDPALRWPTARELEHALARFASEHGMRLSARTIANALRAQGASRARSLAVPVAADGASAPRATPVAVVAPGPTVTSRWLVGLAGLAVAAAIAATIGAAGPRPAPAEPRPAPAEPPAAPRAAPVVTAIQPAAEPAEAIAPALPVAPVVAPVHVRPEPARGAHRKRHHRRSPSPSPSPPSRGELDRLPL